MILGVNPGHDGAVACIADGELLFSHEAEKDSHERHGPLSPHLLLDALAAVDEVPEVIAVGGWYKVLPGLRTGIAAGYHGLEPPTFGERRLLGRPVCTASSSHERSHLVGSVAMSGFDPDDELAVLVWEGVLGNVYRWSHGGLDLRRIEVLGQPGARYAALYALADPGFPDAGAHPQSSAAGKLMALAAYGRASEADDDSRAVVDSLLSIPNLYPFDKRRYRHSALHDAGVHTPVVHHAAAYLSDRLLERFLDALRTHVPRGLDLAVGGGCGLNCDWNSALDASGWFNSVFVPPCTDDSGSAIGTAADAAWSRTGTLRLRWDTYAGAPFQLDAPPGAGWTARPLDLPEVVAHLRAGEVVAWVEGRCEIGPRALGHRSLLADPTRVGSRDLLNEIKQREPYRPVAPLCAVEHLGDLFDSAVPDPHMLRFRRVTRPDLLPAVTHVDGSARVQSVDAAVLPTLHRLLGEFRAASGVPVLCNTSLNFPGRGFLNRLTELLGFAEGRGIDTVVVDSTLYRRGGGDHAAGDAEG